MITTMIYCGFFWNHRTNKFAITKLCGVEILIDDLNYDRRLEYVETV